MSKLRNIDTFFNRKDGDSLESNTSFNSIKNKHKIFYRKQKISFFYYYLKGKRLKIVIKFCYGMVLNFLAIFKLSKKTI